MEIPFSGPSWAGSLEFDAHGITVFAAPSDPDARPHMTALSLDPTPEQADAISLAFAEWAALARARQRANDPLPLLILMGSR